MMKPWIEKARADKPKRNLPAKLAVSNLKLCPLCESLNARTNQVCFVCGWHGEFIHDSRNLHTSLVLLLEQCPELADGVHFPAKPTLFKRVLGRAFLSLDRFKNKLVSRFSRPRGRRLDLWV